MSKDDLEMLLRQAYEDEITEIEACYVDVLGQLKILYLPKEHFGKLLEEGTGVDLSSITQVVSTEQSDYRVKAVPESYTIIPWKKCTARIFCNVLKPCDGNEEPIPYEGDSRYVLRKVVEESSIFINEHLGTEDGNYQLLIGPEIEFFVIDRSKNPDFNKVDSLGYFDPVQGAMDDLRGQIVSYMREMGLQPEYSHHEVAPSQMEVGPKFRPALPMADATVMTKDIIRRSADAMGYLATFIPKLWTNENGSGMHLHVNMAKVDENDNPVENLFLNRDTKELSQLGLHFMGGVLKHADAIAALTNPTCISYKRLVPGWEAPTAKKWGRRNRTGAIRQPDITDVNAIRIEIRFPDPSANPYLAYAAILAAGIDGIKNEIDPGDPTEEDIYKMENVPMLPKSLDIALDHLDGSAVLRQALGKTIVDEFLEVKRKEVMEYGRMVTNVDMANYLRV